MPRPDSPASTRPKTAFVLAGGGSYGVVQVGMLRALRAHGIRPDLIAGSSVGAINGAFFAGDAGEEGIERLGALWNSLTRRDVFPIVLSRLLSLVRSDHLFEPHGLRRLLATHLPHARLEESAIPLHVMATDLLSGAPVQLSRGSSVDAVLASCAIPGIFPPVRIDDRLLIDGAVACNTPIQAAIALGATRLILLPTAFACPHAAPPRGVFRAAFHAMDLIVMQQLARDTELYAAQARIVTVPPICPLTVPPYDFSRAGELIDAAARSTGQWLERGGLDGDERYPGHRGRQDCAARLPSCPNQRRNPNAVHSEVGRLQSDRSADIHSALERFA